MWLSQVLQSNLVRYPDAVAVRDRQRAVTWRQFHREVSALAHTLAGQVPAGARVATVSANRTEVLRTYFACAAAGSVIVPINPALADPEITDILASVEPSLAVADPAGRERLKALGADLPALPIEDPQEGPVRPLPEPCELSAPFAILHTSATTGRPKGVVIDHRSLQTNALSWLAEVRPEPGTAFLTACPLFHGSVVIPLHYLAGGAAVGVLESFTPQACLTALETWRIQHLFVVPSMLRLLLEARGFDDADLSALKLVLHAAAPMPPELAAEASEKLGVALQNIFGITEGGGTVLSLRPEDRPGPPPVAGAVCVGVPMPGTAARIVLDDGRPAAPAEVGEIQLSGDGLLSCYWKNPEATAEAVVNGWLNTRDLGCFDDAGFLWVVDRRNDLILRGGQNVYPAEIEHVLRQSPLVADVAVVPGPSRIWGQTPIAFVQPRPPLEALDATAVAELVDLCAARLAGYKRPSRFVLADPIPRNPAGKILRQRLRARADDLEAGGESR